MTKVIRDVEIGDVLIEDVEFEGYPYWDDDSYDDEFGTVVIQPYPSMADEDIFWNKKLYSEEENNTIQSYLDVVKNFMDICEDLEEQFASDENTY